MMNERPRLAVWKLASCDGCQLCLLDCEDELLEVANAVEIAFFPEASRKMAEGPYDLTLVEGSITTPDDIELIHEIRDNTELLVTIGACATAGGIQALRNWADVEDFAAAVYASPEYLKTLATSTPIREHVPVDLELHGCPISKHQLLETVAALLAGRSPDLPDYSVCVECKRRGTPCVMVAKGIPCLGPITRAGCNALCPAFDRGCFGCFGPAATTNVDALAAGWEELGAEHIDLVRALRSFNGYAPEFREASERYARSSG